VTLGERGVSRRTVLGGAAGGVAALAAAGYLVEQDMLPGRSRVYRVLGLNGDGAPMPDAPPGDLVTGSFVSRPAEGAEIGWAVSYPAGFGTDARLPVFLVLHGASGNHLTPFDTLGLDRFLTLVLREGTAPFAIAAADGPGSWWPGPSGDPSTMLTDELLPMLADRGLDTERLALGGWSRGGYGALRLAGSGRVTLRAVAVLSPALSEDDDVVDRPEALAGIPLRVDCGRGDAFYRVVREFVDRLEDQADALGGAEPENSFGLGGHTPEYWRSVAPHQLRFVGEHLAAAPA
jgi:hypothetical protein